MTTEASTPDPMPAPNKKPEAPAKSSAKKPELSVYPTSAPYVVGNGLVDIVSLSAIIYKNERSRKSLSVLHVQRRLGEWGYGEAAADIQGYYSDLTEGAMRDFQKSQGLEATGMPDAATLETLFKSDPNVELAP